MSTPPPASPTVTLVPVQLALPQAQETDIATSYGRFSAVLWYAAALGWLAHVRFDIGEDITIHRRIPMGMTEVDAAQWVQAAYAAGPQFLLPLLEATDGN